MIEAKVFYNDINIGSIIEKDKLPPLFLYSDEAKEKNINLSPIRYNIQKDLKNIKFASHLNNLPGFIDDCIPDGWGGFLIERLFNKEFNKSPTQVQKLLFCPKLNLIGALSFKPHLKDKKEENNYKNLNDLVLDSRKALEDKTIDFKQLIKYNGSANGVRPKACCYLNFDTQEISLEKKDGFNNVIIKFLSKQDDKDTLAIEQLYNDIAREIGIKSKNSKYLKINNNNFAIAFDRFDRDGEKKIHTHTLAGLLHADFRNLSQVSYENYLQVVWFLTKDKNHVKKAFEYTLFNIVFNNKDDHCKNFSFLMNDDFSWSLSDPYDLTFTYGYNGNHSLSINNKNQNFSYHDLFNLAKPYLDKNTIDEIIDKISFQASLFKHYINNDYGIMSNRINEINKNINLNLKYLNSKNTLKII